MQLPVSWILPLLVVGLSGIARAEPTSTINSSVRALGMGDAYTALADDESSLFYNPAGLARVRGINWRIFSADAGASGAQAYTKLKGLQSGSGSGFSSAINSLYGEHVSADFGGESIFTIPMLGFGTYSHTDALLRIDNPVYPTLRTRLITDYGYVMGFGIPMGFFHLGMDFKYIRRSGTDGDLGPATIADLDSKVLKSKITPWGVGYGADLGASVVVPLPFFTAAASVAWKNMGKTNFTSDNASLIPPEDNDITLGAGLDFRIPLVSIRPAIDFRYLNRSDLQLGRKINFGVEVGLPIIDLRGGFREGYYTAGVGVNLGLFRVDAATYGVELGDYPGQIEDRRYVAEFTMQIGLGSFSATGDSTSKSGGGSGSGKGAASSDNSIWGGGHHLKQRR